MDQSGRRQIIQGEGGWVAVVIYLRLVSRISIVEAKAGMENKPSCCFFVRTGTRLHTYKECSWRMYYSV